MVFGNNPKLFCPSKVLGAFCPGNATKIWFFEKPKTKSVLVYMKSMHKTLENLRSNLLILVPALIILSISGD